MGTRNHPPPTEQSCRRFTPCIQIHRASLERHERRASWCERWRSIAPIASAALQAIVVLVCLPGGMCGRGDSVYFSDAASQHVCALERGCQCEGSPVGQIGYMLPIQAVCLRRQRSSRLRRIGTSMPLRRQWTRQVVNSHRSWKKRCVPVYVQTPCPPARGHTRACAHTPNHPSTHPPARTHARTRSRTHACTYARTHARTPDTDKPTRTRERKYKRKCTHGHTHVDDEALRAACVVRAARALSRIGRIV